MNLRSEEEWAKQMELVNASKTMSSAYANVPTKFNPAHVATHGHSQGRSSIYTQNKIGLITLLNSI